MAIKVSGTVVVDDNRNIINANSASFTGNTGIELPVGTTAQRSASPKIGTLRFNTQDDKLEIYKAGGWASAGPKIGSILFGAGFRSDGSG